MRKAIPMYLCQQPWNATFAQNSKQTLVAMLITSPTNAGQRRYHDVVYAVSFGIIHVWV